MTKWDQLVVHPELLRSLVRFGYVDSFVCQAYNCWLLWSFSVGPPNKIQQHTLLFLLHSADIIAQAPPTQERIAAYIIPTIHIALTVPMGHVLWSPLVIMILITVDQATQVQHMIRDLGGPVGVRSVLGIGSASNVSKIAQELNNLCQNMPHIICGTAQKLHLFTSNGGTSGSKVWFLVLDYRSISWLRATFMIPCSILSNFSLRLILGPSAMNLPTAVLPPWYNHSIPALPYPASQILEYQRSPWPQHLGLQHNQETERPLFQHYPARHAEPIYAVSLCPHASLVPSLH